MTTKFVSGIIVSSKQTDVDDATSTNKPGNLETGKVSSLQPPGSMHLTHLSKKE